MAKKQAKSSASPKVAVSRQERESYRGRPRPGPVPKGGNPPLIQPGKSKPPKAVTPKPPKAPKVKKPPKAVKPKNVKPPKPAKAPKPPKMKVVKWKPPKAPLGPKFKNVLPQPEVDPEMPEFRIVEGAGEGVLNVRGNSSSGQTVPYPGGGTRSLGDYGAEDGIGVTDAPTSISGPVNTAGTQVIATHAY